MKADLMIRPQDFSSTFLACEKDTETILRRLFIESRPYSDQLKRLLVLNTRDCLDNKQSKVYQQKIDQANLGFLRKNGYIRLEPKIMYNQHEQVKSYIILTFDNFITNVTNPEFRDCIVSFDILCHPDYWDLGDYRMRPLKIAGYIDGILNRTKLAGIGLFQFLGCNQIVLNENVAGYTLMYRAVNDINDKNEPKSQDPLFKS